MTTIGHETGICERCGHRHERHIYVQGVPTDCALCACESYIGIVEGFNRDSGFIERRRYDEPPCENGSL